MKRELIVHRNPKSPNSEIFRTLRTNIQFMNTNKKLKTILVTSTFPGEGKSWVTSNLAVTFAQAGNKVILIDADMRKGRQYKIFDIAAKPGLSNCLSEAIVNERGEARVNSRNYVQETEVENLYVMAAGNVPPNPSELLVSPQMAKLLDDLKEMFDIVIIDGTPCQLVTDSTILSRIVDSTIIVTAHKVTKKDMLARVIKNIQSVGGNISGVVLNKVPVPKKYSQQYYYYGNSSKSEKKDRDGREFVGINERKFDKNSSDISKKTQVKKSNTIIDDDDSNDFLGTTNQILKEINKYIDSEKEKLK